MLPLHLDQARVLSDIFNDETGELVLATGVYPILEYNVWITRGEKVYAHWDVVVGGNNDKRIGLQDGEFEYVVKDGS